MYARKQFFKNQSIYLLQLLMVFVGYGIDEDPLSSLVLRAIAWFISLVTVVYTCYVAIGQMRRGEGADIAVMHKSNKSMKARLEEMRKAKALTPEEEQKRKAELKKKEEEKREGEKEGKKDQDEETGSVHSQKIKEGEKIEEVIETKKSTFALPPVLNNSWTLMHLCASIMLLVTLILEVEEQVQDVGKVYPSSEHWAGVSAAVMIIVFIASLEIFLGIRTIAAFLFTVKAVALDVAKFLLVACVMVLGFAAGIRIIDGESMAEFQTVGDAFLLLYAFVLGLWTPDLHGKFSDPYLQVLIFAFGTIVVILMLNLLIGQITYTYRKVKSQSAAMAQLAIAERVLAVESLMDKEVLHKIADSMNFDQALPFEQTEAGPSGGIQLFQPADMFKNVNAPKVLKILDSGGLADPWPNTAEGDKSEGPLKRLEETIELQMKLVRATVNRLARKMGKGASGSASQGGGTIMGGSQTDKMESTLNDNHSQHSGSSRGAR
eukprot:GDKI01009955.1.p1 GENE.GDKI01009955.1~~GDKI01009955.1.p1  ORF type:complete len:555 (+),score=145.88 GDKI01009955.1:194-1666(+)